MVSEKSLGTGMGKIWYRKSTSIGIRNIWYQKKVSVSFEILGTVTLWCVVQMTYPETCCQNVYISNVWKIQFKSEETDNICRSVDQMAPCCAALLYIYGITTKKQGKVWKFSKGSKHPYIHGAKQSSGNSRN